jgi:hypothetical protein
MEQLTENDPLEMVDTLKKLDTLSTERLERHRRPVCADFISDGVSNKKKECRRRPHAVSVDLLI